MFLSSISLNAEQNLEFVHRCSFEDDVRDRYVCSNNSQRRACVQKIMGDLFSHDTAFNLQPPAWLADTMRNKSVLKDNLIAHRLGRERCTAAVFILHFSKSNNKI